MTTEDMRNEACGRLGPPHASEPHALMAADPDADEVLMPDPEGLVTSSFDLAAWEHHHRSHCHLCSDSHPHKVAAHCYGSCVIHCLRYGWRVPLSHIPPMVHLDNYKSVHEHLPCVHVCNDVVELDVAAGILSITGCASQ